MDAIRLSMMLGVQANVAAFVREHRSTLLAVDGVIETLRAPIPLGWPSNAIRMEFGNRVDYPLDDEAIQLLTAHKKRFTGLPQETKYRIALLEKTPEVCLALRIVLVPIGYAESAGFHRGIEEGALQNDRHVQDLKTRWASQLIQQGTYHLPGSTVMHFVVITGDDKIVLCHRSPNVNYHPLHWSASFEEQLNQDDNVSGKCDLLAVANRGFHEELVPDHDLKAENVTTLAVFLEYGILNLGFCVCIETSLCFDKLKESWNRRARDKWEALDVVGEPFTPDNVCRLLRSDAYGSKPNKMHKFHPTSKYRLLLAGARRFGWDAVIARLADQPEREAVESLSRD